MGSARFLDPSSIPLKRQSGGNIWATLAHVTQAAIIVAVLLVVALFFLPVIQESEHLQKHKAEVQSLTVQAQDKQNQLKLETELIKNDPAYVEHIARDQPLELARPGETIFRFNSYPSDPPDSPSTKPAPESNPASN